MSLTMQRHYSPHTFDSCFYLPSVVLKNSWQIWSINLTRGFYYKTPIICVRKRLLKPIVQFLDLLIHWQLVHLYQSIDQLVGTTYQVPTGLMQTSLISIYLCEGLNQFKDFSTLEHGPNMKLFYSIGSRTHNWQSLIFNPSLYRATKASRVNRRLLLVNLDWL